MNNKTQQLKKRLLDALTQTYGNVTTACKLVKCNRSAFYDNYNKDPEFKKAVDELQNVGLDFAEDKLFALMKDMNPTAIIFYLKTKGKSRGYIESQVLTHEGGLTIHFDKQDAKI